MKKRGIRAIDGLRKQLMIPDFEISKCPEHEVKSEIRTIFVNEKILEEYSIKNYETDPYFYEHYRKKIQTDEASRMQTFISKFKDKEKENEVKKLKDEIKKLKLQLTNQDV